MAARSIEARKRAQAERQAFLAHPPAAAGPPTSDYVAVRLMRVREQLNRLDSMMAKETDPQKLDRLASAQAKVAEQERVLDGRPLPGSRKPMAEIPRRREIPWGPPPLPLPQGTAEGVTTQR
jgi:hypothetical protein